MAGSLVLLANSPSLKDITMSVPYFSQEQVDYLNKLYPERCPDPKHTDREIWIAVGQRLVVRHIEAKFKEQLDRLLTKQEHK